MPPKVSANSASVARYSSRFAASAAMTSTSSGARTIPAGVVAAASASALTVTPVLASIAVAASTRSESVEAFNSESTAPTMSDGSGAVVPPPSVSGGAGGADPSGDSLGTSGVGNETPGNCGAEGPGGPPEHAVTTKATRTTEG